jgi:type IV pilus assembly protein PilM
MSIFSSFGQASGPTAAVELAQHRVSGASLEWRGGQATITAYAVQPLAAGALNASLTTANILDRPAVAGALDRVLDHLGRPRRLALVVPDSMAKVSLVRFEQVPARTQDLDQLVRWQIRKSAPFPIEEAQVSYVAGQRASDGQEFIVTLARREIVREYEELCAAAGAHAGIVDLATFNVINAALAVAGSSPAAGDWLLVNVAADFASLAILRNSNLIFFRNRSSASDGTLADLVHQTAMYYVDRLSGAGFARVMLTGGGAEAGEARRSVEERLSTPVETIDPSSLATLTDRISASPALLDALTPLVGVLLRGREVAA